MDFLTWCCPGELWDLSVREEGSRGSRRVSEGGTDTAQGKIPWNTTHKKRSNEGRFYIQIPQFCLVALQSCSV